jgi:alpha-ketoglutarate-dependent taurine dioxygenase
VATEGKAVRLAWSTQDVIAADNTRILLAAETTSRNDKLWSLETEALIANPPMVEAA